MDRLLNPGKLEVTNLTPHPVTIIDHRMCSIKRNGQINLQEGVDIQEATLEKFYPSGTSLSVQEDQSNYDKVGDICLYSQLGNARFDTIIPTEELDNDLIIVSSRCARLFLIYAFGIISGVNQYSPISLIDIDRVYTPTRIVYNYDPYTGKTYPIGALGLQQVTPMLTLAAYQQQLLNPIPEMQIPISVASVIKKVNAIKTFSNPEMIPEEITEYIRKRGF